MASSPPAMTQSDKREWDELEESERNCLLWPDFHEWGDVHHVDIDMKGSVGLGIVSVVLTIEDSKISFHIIKKVMEGMPASGKVEKCDWIIAVGDKQTINMHHSSELARAIKNAHDQVKLLIRKPKNPLRTIKQWKKKHEELKMPSGSLDCCFTHFYINGDKQKNIEDKILVYKKLKDGKPNMDVVQLERGDELVSVNNTKVGGKRLKEIHDLVKTNAKVILSIRKLLPQKEFQESVCTYYLRLPSAIYWSPPIKSAVVESKCTEDGSNPSLGFILSSSKKSKKLNSVYHVVTEVRAETTASEAGLCVGDRLMTVNGIDLTNLERREAAELFRKHSVLTLELARPEGLRPEAEKKLPKRQKNRERAKSCGETPSVGLQRQEIGSSRTRRRSESNSVSSWSSENANSWEGTQDGASSPTKGLVSKEEGGSLPRKYKSSSSFKRKNKRVEAIAEQSEQNGAYCSSDNELPGRPEQKKDMCKTCNEENRERLPKDKLEWPIDRVNFTVLKSICRKLDMHDETHDIRLLASELSFSQEEIKEIHQQHSNKGFIGSTEMYINGWVKKEQDHSIGKLRNICEKLQRNDVCQLIDEWIDRQDDCRGCGAIMASMR